jgi:CheY-like chemotaxis protein
MKRTLLVVDDEKSVRECLRMLAERRGYTVVVAENGSVAINLAAQHPIDAALVDVHMPGMHGVAVCRALHTQAAANGRTIAVWMMTGARTTDLVRSAADAGAREVLGKPFNNAELFKRFDDYFNGVPLTPAKGAPSPPTSRIA